MIEFILLFIIFLIWGMRGPKEPDMLPNGCVSTGHKYNSYKMCKICGHYE